jgi:hypothetical protein
MMRLILERLIEPVDRNRILADLGLELSNLQEEPGRAYFEVWMPLDLDDEAVIHYVDDVPIGVRYFVVEGEQRWAQHVRQSFPVMTDEAILERMRTASSDAQRIEATFMIALIGGREPRENALAELKASLHHPSEEVRYAAILAAGYTSWPALEVDLEELAERDGSPRVQDRAQRLLQQVAEYGWEE